MMMRNTMMRRMIKMIIITRMMINDHHKCDDHLKHEKFDDDPGRSSYI